jgi:hypothetical protein
MEHHVSPMTVNLHSFGIAGKAHTSPRSPENDRISTESSTEKREMVLATAIIKRQSSL